MVRVVIVDVLARGKRLERRVTVDVIGVGPRAVAGLLARYGVRADVYEAELIAEEPGILADYDILFVSAMSSDAGAARSILRLWRRISGGAAIIGGPITSEPGVVAKLGFDFGVYGEAEASIPILAERGFFGHPEKERAEGVRGVIINTGGEPVFYGRPGYAPREALNYLHSTVLDGYRLYWAGRVYVEAVRGCSNFFRPSLRLPDGRQCIGCPLCYNDGVAMRARLRCPVKIPAGCGYCSVPELYGPARSRSIDVIVEEVRRLVKAGVVRVVLSAPDILDYGRDLLVDPEPLTHPCKPSVNYDYLELLFEKLFEAVPEFGTRDAYLLLENVKACLVDERVARILAKYFRGTPVHIGAESGDDRLLRLIGRPALSADVRRAVKLLVNAGLKPYVYFIYGLPGETRDSVLKTLSFMEELYKLGVEKITAYRFRPLPGTAFEGFTGEPSNYSLMIREKAAEINERSKLELVGQRFKAIVAGWHGARRSLVAYLLPHGPAALLRGPKSLVGWLVEIVVSDVASDRLVYARLVKRLRPVAKRAAPKPVGLGQ